MQKIKIILARKIALCCNLCYNAFMQKILQTYLDNIEKQLQIALPACPDAQWATDIFGTLPEAVLHDVSSLTSTLMPPCRELVFLGGKRWRPLLLVLTTLLVSQDPSLLEIAYKLCTVVELVHTASLIHDDIEDSSLTRRGKSATYVTHGVDVALNAGSWLYFVAASFIKNAPVDSSTKLELFFLYEKQLARLHLGQALDISWHKDLQKTPTPTEYFFMVKCKTGTLCAFSMCMAALVAKKKELCDKLEEIALDIGAGFQILDDVINLKTGNKGKQKGDDIIEGKKSLPVLLFLQKAGEKDKALLQECFKKAGEKASETLAITNAIALLNQAGVIDSAFDTGQAMIHNALHRLRNMFPKECESSFYNMISNLFNDMIASIS